MNDATKTVLCGLGYCGWVGAAIALADVSIVLFFVALLASVVVPTVYLSGRWKTLETEVEASEAGTHKTPPLGRIEGLMLQHPADLQRRVAAIRCYASPEYRGSIEGGRIVGVYHTLAIDHDGGVHTIDTSGSFGELEERAEALASRIGVPFGSLI